ncbi:putative RNA-directed DNA polymerase, eukaryota, reverse transcriptase zinc-binding domain protein [Tanacetum coccineum]
MVTHAFNIKNSMSMSVQKSQDHKTATRTQDDDKRLCLVNDLKEVQVHIQVKLYRTSSSLKSKITTSCSQDEVKKTTLHVTLQQVKSMNIFEGIKVGSSGVDVSHFQFADDALIIGKWSHENAKNLCRILRCFELSYGLKVNFLKIEFFSLGASMAKSNNLASSLGCQPSSLPCSYLDRPIGAKMKKSCNWKRIIDKFHKRPIHGGRETGQFTNLNLLLNDFNPASDAPDTWDYVLHNSRIFSVSSMRKWIDTNLSPTSVNFDHIRWNRLLPVKVDIHSWRLGLDPLPTRCNLNARGIDIDSTCCSMCNEGQETSCHLFIKCPVAVGLWNMVSA